ncbi:hypothetical protein HDU87_003972 [Geranomyces variabilis]|uniref:Uncharacterized protein n=1 Tax=Geranomyces variabilis TaxID=109894 RepID=A0AAD5XQJ4_9FUNG|nr:hypothetical protein HDU87_003972 [Geranomyces variabilis]
MRIDLLYYSSTCKVSELPTAKDATSEIPIAVGHSVHTQVNVDQATNAKLLNTSSAMADAYHEARFGHACLVSLLELLNHAADQLQDEAGVSVTHQSVTALSEALTEAFEEHDPDKACEACKSVLKAMVAVSGTSVGSLVCKLLNEAADMSKGGNARKILPVVSRVLQFVQLNKQALLPKNIWRHVELTEFLAAMEENEEWVGEEKQWIHELLDICATRSSVSALRESAAKALASAILKQPAENRDTSVPTPQPHASTEKQRPVAFAVQSQGDMSLVSPFCLNVKMFQVDGQAELSIKVSLDGLSERAKETLYVICQGAKENPVIPVCTHGLTDLKHVSLNLRNKKFPLIGESVVSAKRMQQATHVFAAVTTFLNHIIERSVGKENEEDENTNQPATGLTSKPLEQQSENPLHIALASVAAYEQRTRWRLFDLLKTPAGGTRAKQKGGKRVEDEIDDVEEDAEEDAEAEDTSVELGNSSTTASMPASSTPGRAMRLKARNDTKDGVKKQSEAPWDYLRKKGDSPHMILQDWFNGKRDETKEYGMHALYVHLAADMAFLSTIANSLFESIKESEGDRWIISPSRVFEAALTTLRANIGSWAKASRRAIQKTYHKRFYDASGKLSWSPVPSSLRYMPFNTNHLTNTKHRVVEIAGSFQSERMILMKKALLFSTGAKRCIVKRVSSTVRGREFDLPVHLPISRPNSDMNFCLEALKFHKIDHHNDRWGISLPLKPCQSTHMARGGAPGLPNKKRHELPSKTRESDGAAKLRGHWKELRRSRYELVYAENAWQYDSGRDNQNLENFPTRGLGKYIQVYRGPMLDAKKLPLKRIICVDPGVRVFVKLFDPITGDEFDIGAGIEAEVISRLTIIANLQSKLDNLLDKNDKVIAKRAEIASLRQALGVARASDSDVYDAQGVKACLDAAEKENCDKNPRPKIFSGGRCNCSRTLTKMSN